MRIVAGNLKGSSLYEVQNKITRPLKDLVKESIFNLLIHSKKISFQLEGSNILDLYAGTGSFGLECLSRKAKNVFFIENEKTAFKTLEKNIDKLKLKSEAKIFFQDVFSFVKNNKKLKFNLIFCDAPFKDKSMEKLIELIFNNNSLDQNGVIILHRKKSDVNNFPSYFKVIDERMYGASKIIFGIF